jgi:hypothetical protein
VPLTREAEKIVGDFRNIAMIISKLQKADKRSQIYSILSPIAPAVIDAIPSMKADLKEKVMIFRNLRKTKPLITAKDLQKRGIKPAKQYTRLLDKIFALQLDKILQNRKQALDYLKSQKKK